MKPNIRSLNYGTLYSLTITMLPREPYSIGTITITQLNSKIKNKRIIGLEGEKRVYFQFSYTDLIPTIKHTQTTYIWKTTKHTAPINFHTTMWKNHSDTKRQ